MLDNYIRIKEILDIQSIRLGLEVNSKEECLKEMLILASKSGKVENLEAVSDAVYEREALMSTGIGKGVALPHCKTGKIETTVGAMAVLSKSIEYESIDGEPVNIVFLVLGLENNVGENLRLLSKVSRMLNNKKFREKLFACTDAVEVLKIIDENHENF